MFVWAKVCIVRLGNLRAIKGTTDINTTSKLGLPSNALLRNQHGEMRNTRQTKDESATTKRESNTHATKPTRPQWKTGCGQLRRLCRRIIVRGQFGPCATRLSPGAGRQRSELTSIYYPGSWEQCLLLAIRMVHGAHQHIFQRTPVANRLIIR